MNEGEDAHSSEREVVVERGETYEHADHGRVSVTGLWEGVHHVDSARNTNGTGVIVVRYSVEEEERCVEDAEYADTLEEFLTAIE